MKYLIIVLLLVGCVGFNNCNGIKHVIQITEPTDHTEGDDGGKIQYKIIFGDTNQK